MSQTNYLYLSIALGILVIIFATLYFTQPEPTIGDIYEGATQNVMTCNESLTEWKEEYATVASSTEKQEALEAVLADCQRELEESKNTLSDSE